MYERRKKAERENLFHKLKLVIVACAALAMVVTAGMFMADNFLKAAESTEDAYEMPAVDEYVTFDDEEREEVTVEIVLSPSSDITTEGEVEVMP